MKLKTKTTQTKKAFLKSTDVIVFNIIDAQCSANLLKFYAERNISDKVERYQCVLIEWLGKIESDLLTLQSIAKDVRLGRIVYLVRSLITRVEMLSNHTEFTLLVYMNYSLVEDELKTISLALQEVRFSEVAVNNA